MSVAVDNSGSCAAGPTVIVGPVTTVGRGCVYSGPPSPSAGTATFTVSWPAQTPAGGAPLAAGSCVGDGTPTTFSYARTVNAPASGCQSYPNTATFTANTNGTTGSANQTVQACFGAGPPAIAVTKNPKSQTVTSGGTATWTIVVTNTGNTELFDVNVTDALAPTCAKTSADIGAFASMAPGASVIYSCSLANVTTGPTNVAHATGTPPSGPDVTATDSALVNVT